MELLLGSWFLVPKEATLPLVLSLGLGLEVHGVANWAPAVRPTSPVAHPLGDGPAGSLALVQQPEGAEETLDDAVRHGEKELLALPSFLQRGSQAPLLFPVHDAAQGPGACRQKNSNSVSHSLPGCPRGQHKCEGRVSRVLQFHCLLGTSPRSQSSTGEAGARTLAELPEATRRRQHPPGCSGTLPCPTTSPS